MKFPPQVEIASAENDPATNQEIVVSVKAAKVLWSHLKCEDLKTCFRADGQTLNFQWQIKDSKIQELFKRTADFNENNYWW